MAPLRPASSHMPPVRSRSDGPRNSSPTPSLTGLVVLHSSGDPNRAHRIDELRVLQIDSRCNITSRHSLIAARSMEIRRSIASPLRLGSDTVTVNKAANVVLDIESLTQSSEKCSGSPKMTKALSRKGSNRMERRNGEEQDADDATKKVAVKVVCSQMEQFKQSSGPNKTLIVVPASTNSAITDSGDGRLRRFNHLTMINPTMINPRRILLLFASLSSMGTMILIYFTLAIYRRQSFD
ncbi:hypothetical protein Cni_G14729 [Canna indica]|uniref:Uncharacterized protein n=1 Tax=Canna indica TaxID=4628 RepID=A0AAQ3KCL9_9LILI|nr:hypothetical protein Cni_G14729 [Canna indica]